MEGVSGLGRNKMMMSESDWLAEYKMLPDDDVKNYYKEFILDADQKAVVLDYERFVAAIELMASGPDDLLLIYDERINIADDVALTFGDECVYMAPYLKDNQCIDEKVYHLVMQINEQLVLLGDEHNEKNWTIQAMNSDERWIRARAAANEVRKLLERR